VESQMLNFARRTIGALMTGEFAAWALSPFDRRWFLSAVWTHRNSPRSQVTTVVIATNGEGNNGDRAMVQSIRENIDGHITLIVASTESNDMLLSDTSTVVLGRALRGYPLLSGRSVRLLAHHLRRATRLLVIGADIADGSYRPRESLFRIRALQLADDFGVTASLVGSSWSEQPSGAVVKMMRTLPTSVTVCMRDARSLERFQSDCREARGVADLAFALNINKTVTKHDDQVDALSQRIIVNVSGLLDNRLGIAGSMGELVGSLLESNHSVEMLPHVIRSGDDDLIAIRKAVGEYVGHPNLLIVEAAESPDQVRQRVRSADLVVTGRMHLAILSLLEQVPPIILASQGKVEGMVAAFGLEWLALQPDEESLRELGDLVAMVSRSRSAIVDQIVFHLPAVRELALRNFSFETQ